MTKATLHARFIGTRAREALAECTSGWRVLAQVSGAIYVESPGKPLLWISDRAEALHARSILVDSFSEDVDAPQPTSCSRPSTRKLGDAIMLEALDAEEWEATWRCADSRDIAPPLPRWQQAISRLLAETAVEQNLARSLLQDDGFVPNDTFEARIVRALKESTDRLAQVSSGDSLLDALERSEQLIGLGCGLTPSGDDILSAYLYVLRSAEIVWQESFDIDWDEVVSRLESRLHRTNPISAAIMLDCAQGDAVDPLHQLVSSLLCGASLEEVVSRIRILVNIGHSSGWDMLVGITAAAMALKNLATSPVAHQPLRQSRMGTGRRHLKCRKEAVHVQ
jgi:hypothetical protein